MKTKRKSFRFYADDYNWLAARKADKKKTFIEILDNVLKVHTLFSHFFEQKHGPFMERTQEEFVKLVSIEAKVYGVPSPLSGKLDAFFEDEKILMGNTLSKTMIFHLLIKQYKYYVINSDEVHTWYRQNMPHVLEGVRL